MKKLFLLINIFFLVSCGESQNKTNMISYNSWKESVLKTPNITDFQKETLNDVFDDISSETFERLTKKVNKIDEPLDSFLIFEYSEGEVVSFSLNFFVIGQSKSFRSTIRFEYGKAKIEDKMFKKSIKIEDYLKPTENKLVDSSDFIIITRNKKSEVKSLLNNASSSIEELLY